jgi:leader peptidase (prepilin peptidase) / N-methyltransferase
MFYRLRGEEGLGLGDAKLFAAGGAWLGWQALPPVLLVSAASALLYVVMERVIRRSDERRIAFGPWLSAGIWIVWLTRPS